MGPTAIPPRLPNAWVVLMLDAHAERALSGLRVTSIEFANASGTVVARAAAPIEVRVAPRDRGAQDFSSYGTTELPAAVPADARLRLRVYAPLDTLLQNVVAPATYRARLRVDGDAEVIEVRGPVDSEWPTA